MFSNFLVIQTTAYRPILKESSSGHITHCLSVVIVDKLSCSSKTNVRDPDFWLYHIQSNGGLSYAAIIDCKHQMRTESSTSLCCQKETYPIDDDRLTVRIGSILPGIQTPFFMLIIFVDSGLYCIGLTRIHSPMRLVSTIIAIFHSTHHVSFSALWKHENHSHNWGIILMGCIENS